MATSFLNAFPVDPFNLYLAFPGLCSDVFLYFCVDFAHKFFCLGVTHQDLRKSLFMFKLSYNIGLAMVFADKQVDCFLFHFTQQKIAFKSLFHRTLHFTVNK